MNEKDVGRRDLLTLAGGAAAAAVADSTGWIGMASAQSKLSDIVSMMFGFAIAWRVPAWFSIGLVIVLEIAVAAVIRDNLTLNILMLIHPFEAIKHWQLGV